MDPEIVALAGTAGSTVVTLLTTDMWQSVKQRLVGFWQDAGPERADRIAAELEDSRHELISAREAGDRGTEEELTREWVGRIRRLLVANPEIADGLRDFLNDATRESPVSPSINMQATASGNSRVYQAGQNMNVGQQ